MSFSFLLRAIRGRQVSIRKKESNQMSKQSFRELGASAPVVAALAARSIHEPFTIQELVLPDALQGLDVLVRSPTGSGKTLAFAVPIVERIEPRDPRPSALVLVPTRELAAQVTAELEPLAGEVGRLARAYTNSPSRIEGELSAGRQPGEIDHHFVAVTADTKVETLIEHIRSSRSTLVFVRTKRGADRLVQRLAAKGVTAVAMHGDMSQSARERALSRFERGQVETLVATDVAARGLDLDDVTHVINFDPPE